MDGSGRDQLALRADEAVASDEAARPLVLQDAGACVRAALEDIRKVPGNQRRGERVFPHPFPARMPMAVAEIAIKRLSLPGQVILDPMVGSGTTTHAATVAGRVALGVDMDPLAVILARTFSSLPRASVLHDLGGDVLFCAKARSERLKLGARRAGMEKEDRAFLDYWFPKAVQQKLFCLIDAIEEVVPIVHRGAFFTIFSSLIIARSSGVSYALDLSRTRPHKDPDKILRDPFDLWAQRILDFARYSVRAPQTTFDPDIRQGDARNLDHVASSTVDLVLSSPPYGTAIDYIRASKFSLVFLNCPLSALREIRGISIGSERGLWASTEVAEVEALLPRRDTRRAAVLRRYLRDLYLMMRESARVLRPGGIAAYAVGPSITSTTRYDAADVMATLGEAAGLRFVGASRRNLSDSNRSLPPPRRASGEGSIHKRMNCEYYVGFVKD